MDIYTATIHTGTLEQAYKLRELCVDIFSRLPDPTVLPPFSLDVLILDEQLQRLRQLGYEVSRLQELPGFFDKRLAMVSTGEPYKFTDSPHDLLSDPYNVRYFTADDIDNMLDAWARQWPQLIKLFPLPNKTWGWGGSQLQPRTCKAALLGAGQTANRTTVFFSGGVHAREWITADVCMNVLYFLTTAYNANIDLRLTPSADKPGKTFTKSQIKAIMERLLIIIFPDVNPDGRIYSQSNAKNLLWRKNRRPFQGNLWGVDINRNYDFLWQYRGFPHDKFDISDTVANDNYKGPFAFSEPETRNMQFVLDSYNTIEYFVDVHSNTQKIYLAWGDAPRQQKQELMKFSNLAYDSSRGDITNTKYYGEYLLESDYNDNFVIASKMSRAMQQVRGLYYEPTPSATGYALTVATSDDYALSRQILNPKRRKIHTFTLECRGPGPGYTPDNVTERNNVIFECCAGLIELCCVAAGVGDP